MAGSPLQIDVDRTTFALGEVVRGQVRVLETMARAKSLDVHVESSGQRVSKGKWPPVIVAHGPLEAGATYPFEVPLPTAALFSFRGVAYSNSYQLVARADVDWAIDPKLAIPIEVWPRPLPPTPEAIEAAVAAVPPPKPTALGCRIIGYVLIAPFVVLLLPLAPFMLWSVAKRYLLRTRIADFTLDLPPRAAVLGEDVPVTVRFRLKRSVEVARIAVRLRGTEQWQTQSGKNSTTHYHHFHTEDDAALVDTVLACAPEGMAQPGGGGAYRGAPRVTGGEPTFEWRTRVRLPPTGLPTIGNSIYYRVTATVSVRGWPDGTIEKPLPTIGARLTAPLALPELPAHSETSRGIVFVRRGEPPPAGIELPARGAGIWPWFVAVFFGSLMTPAGVIIVATQRRSDRGPGWGLLAAGIALLLLGVAGGARKIWR